MEPADVLGGAAASHIPVIVGMLEGIGDHRYEFMSAEQFDVIAHFAASTSLIRTARWIDGMLTLSDDTNFTAFNAAYRGC